MAGEEHGRLQLLLLATSIPFHSITVTMTTVVICICIIMSVIIAITTFITLN